jgi:hypothetical protein
MEHSMIKRSIWVIMFALVLGVAPRAEAQDGAEATIAAQATTIANLEATITALTGGPSATATPSAASTTEVTPSPYLGGNAYPVLLPGEQNALSVVAYGEYDRTYLPVLIRNTTEETLYDPAILATAKDGSGAVVAVGEMGLVAPRTLRPGEYALGLVDFEFAELQTGTTYTFDVTATTPETAPYYNFRDVKVDESTLARDRVVGTFSNDSGFEYLSGGLLVMVACFDADGSLVSIETGFTDTTPMPDETMPFQVVVQNPDRCATYLVASTHPAKV